MLPDHFRVVSQAVVIAGMQVVRRYQIGGLQLGEGEIKPEDKTIVTACDRASQRAMLYHLDDLIANAVFIGEEKDAYDRPLNIQPDEGQDGWLCDPVDGTSALLQGLPTSAVVAAYRYNHQVVGCTIGVPSTGQMWSAVADSPCYYDYWDPCTSVINPALSRETRVWNGLLAYRKSVVYVDVSHGWGATGTTDENLARLYGRINPITNVIMPGSNALMQALVANGGSSRVAASISTAKGGPWDLCGVRLVLSAGGFACGYTKTEKGWQECNPLDVDTSDALICANSHPTLTTLREIFLETMS